MNLLFFVPQPIQLILIFLELALRALSRPANVLYLLIPLTLVFAFLVLSGHLGVGTAAKIAALGVAAVVASRVSISSRAVAVASGATFLACVEQSFFGKAALSAQLVNFLGFYSGHFEHLGSRSGGLQFSPNYMAFTMLSGLIVLQRAGLDSKPFLERPAYKYVGVLFGVLSILLSGSKTTIVAIPFLIKRLPLLFLAPLGGLVAIGVGIKYNVFENWQKFGAGQFTVSNRLDGYKYAFNWNGWSDMLFGHGVSGYRSAFDSTWSLAHASGGIAGMTIALVCAYKICFALFRHKLLGLAMCLVAISFFHPIFFHSIVTPLLLFVSCGVVPRR